MSFSEEIYRLFGHVTESLGGVDAIFTPIGTISNVSVVSVHFLRSTQIQPSGGFQTWELGNTIEYSIADIPREVVVGESFTIDGQVHVVRSLESNNGYSVKVVVS